MNRGLVLLFLGVFSFLLSLGCSSEDGVDGSINRLNRNIQGKWILTAHSGGIMGIPKTPVEDQIVIEFISGNIFKLYDYDEESGNLDLAVESPYHIIYKKSDINDQSYYYLVLDIQSSPNSTTISIDEGELILGLDVVDGMTSYYVSYTDEN